MLKASGTHCDSMSIMQLTPETRQCSTLSNGSGTCCLNRAVTRISFRRLGTRGEEHVLNRTEDVALLVARLLVAALLLPSGIDKLLHFSRFVASLAAKGVPYAKFV